MIQLLVDHSFIAQQLVQFLFQRQEEMIGDRVYFRATQFRQLQLYRVSV